MKPHAAPATRPTTRPGRPADAANTQVVAGAWCWILMVEYFGAQLVSQAAWPGYSPFAWDVSALGVTTCGPFVDPITHQSLGWMCSPLHAVMNSGFVLLGALIILGAVLTRSAWPRRRSTTLGLALIALGGLGEICAGLAPGDVNVLLHASGALLHWIGGGLGLAVLGYAVWPQSRRLAVVTLLCSAIAVVGFVLYGNHMYLGLGRGGMQRAIAYPPVIWLICRGVMLLATARAAGSQPTERGMIGT